MGSLSELQSFSNDPEALLTTNSFTSFVFVNFSQLQRLEQFHGKPVILDPNHSHSPFPALFLIQEMRTRGFHPWFTDQPIPCPSSTYTPMDNGRDGGMAGFGGGNDTGVGVT